MNDTNTVTCSFSMDRDIYNAYKSVLARHGESVKGNIIQYMRQVISYEMPNAETIAAIEEVKRLKADPNKKTYGSFAEIMKEIEDE